MGNTNDNDDRPSPMDEQSRLQALRELRILDTDAEIAYDDITLLASRICETPVALISLVDETRVWFKSKIGLSEGQFPREHALCARTILRPFEPTIIDDTFADPQYRDNPLVTDHPNIRFYAGVPLTTSRGHALGALCVIDRVSRKLDEPQLFALRALARQVLRELELRRVLARLEGYRGELELANQDLQRRSLTDGLTGLWNRAAFERRLGEETARVRRTESAVGLLFLDVDRFKNYNDSHGHLAGDDALVRISALIRSEARQSDFAARYGGEEFAVLLPDTEKDGCVTIAERIRSAVESANWPLGPVTVSIGVSSLSGDAADGEELVSIADVCLYKAKDMGRNRVFAEDG